MRVLRTSLTTRTTQQTKRVSEEEHDDNRDHDEPRQRIANPRLEREEEEGEEKRHHEEERDQKDENGFELPSIEPQTRTADRFRMQLHKEASLCP